MGSGLAVCVCCAPARRSLGCQGSGALSLLWGWREAVWWQRHITWTRCSCPAQMGCGGAPFERGSHSGGCSICSKFCELDLSVLKLPRLGLILHVFRCICRKVSVNSKKSSLLGDIPSLPMGSLSSDARDKIFVVIYLVKSFHMATHTSSDVN